MANTAATAPAGQRRVLAAATLIDSAGAGRAWPVLTCSSTRGHGLSIATAGLGLSIAGLSRGSAL
jgi:hypothetical protein